MDMRAHMPGARGPDVARGTASVEGPAEVGDTVEITAGPSEGKRGNVIRIRGEGDGSEWCVRVGFREVWTSSLKVKVKGALAPTERQDAASCNVGDQVRILSGPQAGTVGTLNTVGRGVWGVMVGDDCVWAEQVAPESSPAPSKPPGVPAGEIAEGDFVEILDGAAAGNFGTVAKVTGDVGARRYKVQVEGKAGTSWAEQVNRVDKSEAAKGPKLTGDALKAERRAHYATLRPADVNSVPWAKAKGLWALDGGSGGVLLVDLEEECVVVKPQGQTATSELIAEHVAKCLDIRVAATKLVKAGQSEHSKIVESCGRLLGKADMSEMGHLGIFKGAGAYEGGMPVYGILEYVPGVPLMGLDAQKVMASPPQSLLVELGRLCALDVLLNNMDRVPLPLWQNDGNMGNVMIAGQGTTIIGIDQQVNSIRAGAYRDNYLKKVSGLIEEIAPGGNTADLAANLVQVIYTNCRITMEAAEVEHVIAGLREGFLSIAKASKDGRLEEALAAAGAACTEFADVDKKLYDEHAVADMKNFVAAVGLSVANKAEALGA